MTDVVSFSVGYDVNCIVRKDGSLQARIFWLSSQVCVVPDANITKVTFNINTIRLDFYIFAVLGFLQSIRLLHWHERLPGL